MSSESLSAVVVPLCLGQSIDDSANSPDNASNPTIKNSTIDFAGAGRDNNNVENVDDDSEERSQNLLSPRRITIDDTNSTTLNAPSSIDEASVEEDTINPNDVLRDIMEARASFDMYHAAQN